MSRFEPPANSIAASEKEFALMIETAIALAGLVIKKIGDNPNGRARVQAYRIAQLRLKEIELLTAVAE